MDSFGLEKNGSDSVQVEPEQERIVEPEQERIVRGDLESTKTTRRIAPRSQPTHPVCDLVKSAKEQKRDQPKHPVCDLVKSAKEQKRDRTESHQTSNVTW